MRRTLKILTLEAGTERDEAFYGLQANLILSFAEKATGVQVSGLVSFVEKELRGAQVSVFVSVAPNDGYEQGVVKGVQVSGIISRAGELQGAQLSGVISYADKAKGVQVGLVDIVLEADRVVQVGGLCIIKSNPWYAKCLPFLNYGGNKEKRDRRKRLMAELLKKEREELEREKLGVRV